MKKFVILLVNVLLLISAVSFLACAQVELNFLEVYTNNSRTILLNNIIADFEKLHPDIKVNLISPPYEQAPQKAMLMLSTKQPLDIVETKNDTLSLYVKNNFLISLEDYLAAWPDSKTLTNGAWMQARTVENTAYTMPSTVYCTVVFYRTDIFKKYGIDHPPRTVTEMFEMAKQLTDPSNNQYGFAFRGKSSQIERIGDMALGFLDDDIDPNNEYLKTDGSLIFDDPRFIEALKLYVRFYHETAPKDSIGWGFSEQINAFTSGTTPIILQHPDFIAFMDKMIGREKYATAPFPLGPYGKTYVVYYSPALAITSHSEHKDEAWEFIKYLTSPEVNADFSKKNGTLPIHNVTYENDPYFSVGVYEAWKYMSDHPEEYIPVKAPLDSPKWAEWREITNIDCQSLELGKVSIEDIIAKWMKYWK